MHANSTRSASQLIAIFDKIWVMWLSLAGLEDDEAVDADIEEQEDHLDEEDDDDDDDDEEDDYEVTSLTVIIFFISNTHFFGLSNMYFFQSLEEG